MVGLCCLKSAMIGLVPYVCFLTTAVMVIMLLLLPAWAIYWRYSVAKKKRTIVDHENVTIGIFHPYCNAGGGGERVLWKSVDAIQKKYPHSSIVVYTGDTDVQPDQMLKKVKDTFDIELNRVEFIYLHKRKWVEAYMYPRLTLLAQSLGSIYLGCEALKAFQPDIFIDTMGYAFTYPLFKFIGGCKIISYTHYPTISTDMLHHVQQRITSHNNHGLIANNPILSFIKIIYYRLFAVLYGYVGRCADVVMVNSTWTEDHINSIWKCPGKTYRVYPPCDIEHLVSLPLLSESKKDTIRILSVAQFRPEKNHSLMIRIMYELKSIVTNDIWEKTRLVLVGSCRNEGDEKRVYDLQELAMKLKVNENVEFKLNVKYSELIGEFQSSTVGLHAMWNEHFGISVVECMAAGLITVAHDSGGPKADIVATRPDNRTGFLASDAREYAKIISNIVHMDNDEKMTIRNSARNHVKRFSGETFEREFLRTIEPIFR